MQLEAQEAGLDNGVFVDEAGNVGESSNMNVAFVMGDTAFPGSEVDHILSGCTSLRLLEWRAVSMVVSSRSVEVCDIPVAEARSAREMLLIGSSVKVAPIVEWDGKPIGNGKPGPCRCLRCAIARRQDSAPAKDRLIDVPYGAGSA